MELSVLCQVPSMGIKGFKGVQQEMCQGLWKGLWKEPDTWDRLQYWLESVLCQVLCQVSSMGFKGFLGVCEEM